jgi:hypothetical protein
MLGIQKMIQYRGSLNTLTSQYIRVTAVWYKSLQVVIVVY